MKLTISYCKEMTEIVAKQGDEIENDDDEFLFSKLEYLELSNLKNLISFCSGNYTFKFPSLTEVIVERCPKMLFFSLGESSTPKLQEVCGKRSPEIKKYWRKNLNTTITEMGDGAAETKPTRTLDYETSQADRIIPSTIVFERQVSENFHATGSAGFSEDLRPGVAAIHGNGETQTSVILTESKITRVASSFSDFSVPSDDKDFSTPMDSEARISQPTHMVSHATEKDVTSLGEVMLEVPHQLSNSSPQYVAISVEQDFMLTSTSSTNRTSFEELTTLGCEITEAERNSPTDVFERQVSEDLHSTGTLETNKDLPPVVSTMLENKETLVLTYSKNTGIASSFQDFNATSNDKADPTPGYKVQISLPVHKDSQTTEKDESSLDKIMLGVSPQQSNSSSKSTGTSVEQVTMSTSASSANITSCQELTFSNASHSNVAAESLESCGVSLEIYRSSIELIKEILMKSPAEVAVSADHLLLLSSLKKLKNRPFLNSHQEEIIQLYIENFDTLVDVQKIDWTNAIQISIEDDRRGLAEIDISEEDLTMRISRLSAEKDLLTKRLHEIQEEEDLIRANKKILDAQRVNRKGKMEIKMDALVEAERQQRETEEGAGHVNERWAKFRTLFSQAF